MCWKGGSESGVFFFGPDLIKFRLCMVLRYTDKTMHRMIGMDLAGS